jgi:hypothetical protein
MPLDEKSVAPTLQARFNESMSLRLACINRYVAAIRASDMSHHARHDHIQHHAVRRMLAERRSMTTVRPTALLPLFKGRFVAAGGGRCEGERFLSVGSPDSFPTDRLPHSGCRATTPYHSDAWPDLGQPNCRLIRFHLRKALSPTATRASRR